MMQKIIFSIAFNLFAITAIAQDIAGRNHIVTASQGDSAMEIKNWIDEAVSLSKKNKAEAEKYFTLALFAARRNNAWKLEGEAVLKYAAMVFEDENYPRAFGLYFRARTIYNGLVKSDIDLTKALLGLAKTQYHRGGYRKSSDHLLEAFALSQKLGNENMEAEAAEYLGLVYNAFNNFPASIQYFRKSLEIKNKVGDAKGVVSLAGKLADIYYERRRYDSALYFVNLAFDGAEGLNSKTEMYHARFAKAAILIRQKKWAETETELSLLSLTLAKKDFNFLVRYLALKGSYHLGKNEKEKSRFYYDSSLSIAKQRGFPEFYGIVYKNMAESYYEAGDYQAAFEYSRQYQNVLADINSGENIKNLSNLEGVLNADVSKDEIKLLNTENKLKQLELLSEAEKRNTLERENLLMDSIILQEKNLSEALAAANNNKSVQLDNAKKMRAVEATKLKDEKKLRKLLLAGLFAFLVFGSIILYQYKRQRKKNAIIEKQSDELQTLMKEIHHRVKNNLQVVSSLLNLQSHYIKDAEAVEAVKDSRNRVLSMALIHQSLYQEGDLQSVNVPHYIDKLCSSLFASCNIKPDKIRLEKEIQSLTLKLDTLMPVGLILNELITNSLKYAFPGDKTGVVKIMVKEENNILYLKVQDNGIGLPADFNAESKSSFGFKMINSFLQKLKGTIVVYNDGGAVSAVDIKNYK